MHLKQLSLIFKSLVAASILSFVLVAAPASALVMQQSELDVTVRGMTAQVFFTLNTPCTPYTLDWGDGEVKTVESQEDLVCIQVLQDVELEHTYEKPGDYNITFTQNDRTFSAQVSVPVEVREFGLDEVDTVTSKYVDPNKMLADEEYFIYTITLTDGEVVTVRAGGFTTKELIAQQFSEAGYTGDVEMLTAMAVQEPAENDPLPAPEEEIETQEKISLQKQIINLLNQIISLLRLR